MKTWLVDTGPLVAYLDAADREHKSVADKWDTFDGQFVTTSAVVTEAMYFVSESREGPRRLAELATSSGLEVYDLSSAPELHEAAALMEKYSDTPMDFADATILLVAEALNVHDVFTLDRRGFSTYRTRQRRALSLVLDAT